MVGLMALLLVAASATLAAADNLDVKEANALLSGLGVTVKEVHDAPVSGMWELILEKSGERSVAYLDHAKKHLMPGPVFDLTTRSLVGAQVRRPPMSPTKVDVSSLPKEDSIVLGNPAGTKKMFVFTDPDCPFCKQLHWELLKLAGMEPDLTIYIKMFPLKMHPKAYDKARVILAKHSPKLLDKAFAGEEIPAAGANDPSAPVDASLKLGEKLGVSGTPTMVLPDGRVMTGVKSAVELKKLISL
ncbi:DsbC family protein [Geomonas sp. Red32]|uniref:DsbC family protein n=1 Tax=Geomonas sp. Red32 TaxID=2912856 RepID=UPI00202D0645|nr:DsbC family protein [Geomonas sp. Red32]MCM0083698.1 DsbC family protein [Geomonas sp. Red32]